MSVESVWAAKRAEFDKDYGRCHYCGGYAYVMVGNWVRHMLDEHPDTVRTKALQAALARAEHQK